MDEQEIKEKIAYAYHELYKDMYEDDPKGDWQFACNVWEHFQLPIQPTNAKWLMDREDYQEFARFF